MQLLSNQNLINSLHFSNLKLNDTMNSTPQHLNSPTLFANSNV